MATMCENCYEVDTRKYKHGRICKRCGGLLVQIDEMLLDTISLLNKKGYKTKFCCSGHVYNHPLICPQTYICFECYVKLPSVPEEFQCTGEYMNDRFCVRKDIDDLQPSYKIHEDILKNNLKLLEWATELPQHESNIL